MTLLQDLRKLRNLRKRKVNSSLKKEILTNEVLTKRISNFQEVSQETAV